MILRSVSPLALILCVGLSAQTVPVQPVDPASPYKAAQPTTALPTRPLKAAVVGQQDKLAAEERDARFLMDLQVANQVRTAQSTEVVRRNQEQASAALLEYYTRLLEPQRAVAAQANGQTDTVDIIGSLNQGAVLQNGSAMPAGSAPAAAPKAAPAVATNPADGKAAEDGPTIARRKGLGFIAKGTIVDIRLYTRVNSSIPGPVLGEVIFDVWDIDQRFICIPRGSKCTGASASMGSDTEGGGKIVFSDFIDPSGREIQIAIPVVTASRVGVTGLPGDINYHWGRIFGGSAALAVIGAFSGTNSTSNAAGANANLTSADMMRQNLLSSMGTMSSGLMQRFINTKPDITLEEGSTAKVIILQHMMVKPAQKVY